MIPANMPDLAGHISELEEMHKVAEGKIDAIAQPKMLFSHIDELEIPELNNADTNSPENHQDNGTTPPVNTQPSLSHSTPEYTSVASSAPLPRPHDESGNAALQSQGVELPDVGLLVANYMIYGFYQDWVHQNPGDHLDEGIAEDSKWQVRWKNLFVCQPSAMTHLPVKLGSYLWESSSSYRT